MANYEILYNTKDENGNTLGSKLKPKGHSNGISLSEFARIYFSDETGVQKLYKVIDSARKKWPSSVYAKVLSPDFDNFFKDYACDLDWAKLTTYCGGGSGGPFDINEYIGTYKDNVTKATLDVADKDGTDMKLVAYGQSIDLIHKANDTFDVLINLKFVNIKGVLDFKRDTKNKVIGFHYKFENIPPAFKSYLPDNFQPEGDATRDLTNNVANDFFKDTDNSGKWDYFMGKSSSPYPRGKNDSGVQQNITPKQKIIKNEPYKVAMPDKIVPCDENAYNWDIGCQNNKIKTLNLKFLGKELDGVYTNELRKALLSSGYMDDSNSKITKNMYDEIMSFKLQESIVKKVVLKNLKELLNKNL